jgi:hypothetical protein
MKILKMQSLNRLWFRLMLKLGSKAEQQRKFRLMPKLGSNAEQERKFRLMPKLGSNTEQQRKFCFHSPRRSLVQLLRRKLVRLQLVLVLALLCALRATFSTPMIEAKSQKAKHQGLI